MKILIAIILYTSQFGFAKAQSRISLTTMAKYGTTIIKPTFENLRQMYLCSSSSFEESLAYYNYFKSSSGASYFANTKNKSLHFEISKSYDNVLMVFSEDNGCINQFRNDLKQLLGYNAEPTITPNVESYKLILTNSITKERHRVMAFIAQMSNGNFGMGIITDNSN
jgi:hypothetical protein